MSRKDTVTKEYFSDNTNFADVVNYFVYDGKKVVAPEDLKPLDSTGVALPFGKRSRAVKTVQKHRDVIKYLSGMTDDNTAYAIFGLELQSGVHNAMPVRNMLYDALEYTRQVEDIVRKHKEDEDKPDGSVEYLSGFYKDDKLKPVITIVIFFGAEEWDAPESIYDMFGVKDPEILKYVSDYKINLISPAKMENEDFDKFDTELKQVFKYLKYSTDKEKLNAVVYEDEAYKHISRRTAVLLNTVAGTKLKFSRGKDEVDMCKAIADMIEDAKKEGRNEAREEMNKELENERRKLSEENTFSVLSGLVNDGIITIAIAASRAGMTEAEFEAKMKAKV